jgi:hypothetical protein
VTPKKLVANVPKKEKFLKMADLDAFIRYLHNLKIPDFDDLWSRGEGFRMSSQAKLMHPQYRSNCFKFIMSEMGAVEKMANTLMNKLIHISRATRQQGFDTKDMVSDKKMSTEGMFFIVRFSVPSLSLEWPVPSQTDNKLDTELPALDKLNTELHALDKPDTELPALEKLETELPALDKLDTERSALDKLDMELPALHKLDTELSALGTLDTELPALDKEDIKLDTELPALDNDDTTSSTTRSCPHATRTTRSCCHRTQL